jgi:hypothetical protein
LLPDGSLEHELTVWCDVERTNVAVRMLGCGTENSEDSGRRVELER